jgi:hypothetical protein
MPNPLIMTTYYYTNTLTAIIDPTLAAPTLVPVAKQILGNASFTPGVTTIFADLPAPAWTGYAASATIVWEAPINQPDGGAASLSPSALFRATAVASPETVYGGAMTDGVASPTTGILGSWKANPTIPIQAPGDGLAVVVSLGLAPTLADSQAFVLV